MYTLIVIFYVSFIGIIAMLLLKRREIATGRPNLVSRLGHGTDHTFHAIFSAVGRFFSYINKHTFIALAQWIFYHILKRIRGLYVEIKHRFVSTPQGRRMMDAVRGRGEVRNHGASFYLRKISADNKTR